MGRSSSRSSCAISFTINRERICSLLNVPYSCPIAAFKNAEEIKKVVTNLESSRASFIYQKHYEMRV